MGARNAIRNTQYAIRDKRITDCFARLWIVLIVMLAVCACGIASAAEEKAAVVTSVPTIETRTVSGVVSGVSPTFIAVEYGQDPNQGVANEMALAIDKDASVEGKKSVKELSAGDTVEVAYDEITETTKEGKKLTRRVATAIRFVKPAPRELQNTKQGG